MIFLTSALLNSGHEQLVLYVVWYIIGCMLADGSLALIVFTFLPGVMGGLVRGLIGITKHVGRGKESFKLECDINHLKNRENPYEV